ncbi:MAG: alginate lyase family protein, partial [Pyrinomonadaceae bacterium]
LDELRVRASHLLAAQSERRGFSTLAREPQDSDLFKLLDPARVNLSNINAENLLEHFRSRTSPAFFASFQNREETVAAWRRHFDAQTLEALLDRARRICEGRFDLLGYRDLSFGSPPDFHLEPIAGKRSALVHWSLIDELGADESGDKKIVWELNRQQYFATLGRAYFLTRDESFAETFAAHLKSWMEQNPPKLGVNWLSSLEISFRAISWLWAFYFFKGSASLTPELFLRALKFLYLHAHHLETYLSTYSSPNTHLTGEALGLFYLGTLLPEFRCAARWGKTGREILLAELERHVRPDGVYFEQSSYYQRYTADFYTHFLILSKANGERVEPLLQEKLAALLDHLMWITRPDGTTPFYGDDDGGRLVMLDERDSNDFRATLSTGAALFARTDYKHVAGLAAEETLWLTGARGLEAFDALDARAPESTSRAFADGGYYVMRDGWSKTSNFMLIDCGPHGSLSCGHSHADALSIEVAARGRTLLVDPGTYTYTSSKELRDYFRGTAAHNTLTVDDESSSVPDGPFSWKQKTDARARVWEASERYDYFEGEHNGFARLGETGTHRRSVFFLKNDYWIVRDQIETEGEHRFELNFHFAADARPVETDEGRAAVLEKRDGAQGLEMLSFCARMDDGAWRVEDGWVSNCYGKREEARSCVFSQTSNTGAEFVSFLFPRNAGQGRVRVERIETTGGRAFEIFDEDRRDLFALGCGKLLEAEHVASDFDWAWARLSSGGDVLEELALRGGSRFYFNGAEILNLASRVGYVVARRVGDELKIEVDGEHAVVKLPVSNLQFQI